MSSASVAASSGAGGSGSAPRDRPRPALSLGNRLKMAALNEAATERARREAACCALLLRRFPALAHCTRAQLRLLLATTRVRTLSSRPPLASDRRSNVIAEEGKVPDDPVLMLIARGSVDVYMTSPFSDATRTRHPRVLLARLGVGDELNAYGVCGKPVDQAEVEYTRSAGKTITYEPSPYTLIVSHNSEHKGSVEFDAAVSAAGSVGSEKAVDPSSGGGEGQFQQLLVYTLSLVAFRNLLCSQPMLYESVQGDVLSHLEWRRSQLERNVFAHTSIGGFSSDRTPFTALPSRALVDALPIAAAAPVIEAPHGFGPGQGHGLRTSGVFDLHPGGGPHKFALREVQALPRSALPAHSALARILNAPPPVSPEQAAMALPPAAFSFAAMMRGGSALPPPKRTPRRPRTRYHSSDEDEGDSTDEEERERQDAAAAAAVAAAATAAAAASKVPAVSSRPGSAPGLFNFLHSEGPVDPMAIDSDISLHSSDDDVEDAPRARHVPVPGTGGLLPAREARRYVSPEEVALRRYLHKQRLSRAQQAEVQRARETEQYERDIAVAVRRALRTGVNATPAPTTTYHHHSTTPSASNLSTLAASSTTAAVRSTPSVSRPGSPRGGAATSRPSRRASPAHSRPGSPRRGPHARSASSDKVGGGGSTISSAAVTALARLMQASASSAAQSTSATRRSRPSTPRPGSRPASRAASPRGALATGVEDATPSAPPAPRHHISVLPPEESPHIPHPRRRPPPVQTGPLAAHTPAGVHLMTPSPARPVSSGSFGILHDAPMGGDAVSASALRPPLPRSGPPSPSPIGGGGSGVSSTISFAPDDTLGALLMPVEWPNKVPPFAGAHARSPTPPSRAANTPPPREATPEAPRSDAESRSPSVSAPTSPRTVPTTSSMQPPPVLVSFADGAPAGEDSDSGSDDGLGLAALTGTDGAPKTLADFEREATGLLARAQARVLAREKAERRKASRNAGRRIAALRNGQSDASEARSPGGAASSPASPGTAPPSPPLAQRRFSHAIHPALFSPALRQAMASSSIDPQTISVAQLREHRAAAALAHSKALQRRAKRGVDAVGTAVEMGLLDHLAPPSPIDHSRRSAPGTPGTPGTPGGAFKRRPSSGLLLQAVLRPTSAPDGAEGGPSRELSSSELERLFHLGAASATSSRHRHGFTAAPSERTSDAAALAAFSHNLSPSEAVAAVRRAGASAAAAAAGAARSVPLFITPTRNSNGAVITVPDESKITTYAEFLGGALNTPTDPAGAAAQALITGTRPDLLNTDIAHRRRENEHARRISAALPSNLGGGGSSPSLSPPRTAGGSRLRVGSSHSAGGRRSVADAQHNLDQSPVHLLGFLSVPSESTTLAAGSAPLSPAPVDSGSSTPAKGRHRISFSFGHALPEALQALITELRADGSLPVAAIEGERAESPTQGHAPLALPSPSSPPPSTPPSRRPPSRPHAHTLPALAEAPEEDGVGGGLGANGASLASSLSAPNLAPRDLSPPRAHQLHHSHSTLALPSAAPRGEAAPTPSSSQALVPFDASGSGSVGGSTLAADHRRAGLLAGGSRLTLNSLHPLRDSDLDALRDRVTVAARESRQRSELTLSDILRFQGLDTDPESVASGLGIELTVGTRATHFTDHRAILAGESAAHPSRGVRALSIVLRAFGVEHPVHGVKPRPFRLAKEMSGEAIKGKKVRARKKAREEARRKQEREARKAAKLAAAAAEEATKATAAAEATKNDDDGTPRPTMAFIVSPATPPPGSDDANSSKTRGPSSGLAPPFATSMTLTPRRELAHHAKDKDAPPPAAAMERRGSMARRRSLLMPLRMQPDTGAVPVADPLPPPTHEEVEEALTFLTAADPLLLEEALREFNFFGADDQPPPPLEDSDDEDEEQTEAEADEEEAAGLPTEPTEAKEASPTPSVIPSSKADRTIAKKNEPVSNQHDVVVPEHKTTTAPSPVLEETKSQETTDLPVDDAATTKRPPATTGGGNATPTSHTPSTPPEPSRRVQIDPAAFKSAAVEPPTGGPVMVKSSFEPLAFPSSPFGVRLARVASAPMIGAKRVPAMEEAKEGSSEPPVAQTVPVGPLVTLVPESVTLSSPARKRAAWSLCDPVDSSPSPMAPLRHVRLTKSYLNRPNPTPDAQLTRAELRQLASPPPSVASQSQLDARASVRAGPAVVPTVVVGGGARLRTSASESVLRRPTSDVGTTPSAPASHRSTSSATATPHAAPARSPVSDAAPTVGAGGLRASQSAKNLAPSAASRSAPRPLARSSSSAGRPTSRAAGATLPATTTVGYLAPLVAPPVPAHVAARVARDANGRLALQWAQA